MLLLPVVGTVCPNMSRPYPRYVCFSMSPQGFPVQAFLPLTYYNFCSACLVTVVIFGHLSKLFFLLAFLLTYFLIACKHVFTIKIQNDPDLK